MNLLCDCCTYALYDVTPEQIDEHIEACSDGGTYVKVEIGRDIIWRSKK